ncbi:DNA replication complex GINS protein PSF2 isoform X2 [Cucumis melo]|uniref:DNA replication complex GINS protein PSF2 n=1 Tax=Cucumis melo TaxID=3656 RepID=A0A1S3CIF8_CUCME|nr:DNA replication complex GINS protein PSF2 isoform X2 [Cucumis melo]XP_050943562.1 DNA replication complex GINS protein PSF2 isoform X2 [Cucumis melo]
MAGQSDPQLNLFSAEEVEFVAEDEMLEIVPNMRMDSLHLICLTQILEAERDSQGSFQILPFHYVEISKLLFDHARDDVPDMYLVRSLIEDIRDVRFHKVETSLESIDTRTSAVKIKDLSAMEVNIVRPFVVRALQAIYKHGNPELVPDQDRITNMQTQGHEHGQRRPLRRR